jgi:hypothetical protein
MGLCAACLLTSGSFAGAIGLLLGILLIQITSEHKAKALQTLIWGTAGVVVIALLLKPLILPILGQRLAYQFEQGDAVPHTLAYRFLVWRGVFWPVISQNWLWGVRPTIPATLSWQAEESQYLYLLFRFGIIGLVAHLAWVGITLGWLIQRCGTNAGFWRAVSASAGVTLIVLSIVGLTNEVFTFSGVADYLWITLGMVAHNKRVS